MSIDTIKNIIAPLVKKLCENAAKSEDNVICIIAQELGKLVLGLESKRNHFCIYAARSACLNNNIQAELK